MIGILQRLRGRLSRCLGRSSYDPVAYWSRRSDPNNAEGLGEFVQQRHVDFIRRYAGGCGPFLEYGPGVGRTIKAYRAGSSVAVCDISERYFVELEENATRCGVTIDRKSVVGPTERLPFSDQEFELAVASQVFLHVPPKQLDVVVSELLRVAEKVVVITAYSSNPARRSAAHCFSHDYVSVVSRAGGELSDCTVSDGTIYFTMKGKRFGQ